MQISKFWQIIGLSAALLTPMFAVAQQSAASSASSTPPPPKLEKLEEGEPPSIKIGKPEDKRKITETREDGKVKEIKVQSGMGTTYYIKPNDQVGNALPGDAQSTANHGAEWKVLEFDLGSKEKKAKEDAPTDGAPPAAPQK